MFHNILEYIYLHINWDIGYIELLLVQGKLWIFGYCLHPDRLWLPVLIKSLPRFEADWSHRQVAPVHIHVSVPWIFIDDQGFEP